MKYDVLHGLRERLKGKYSRNTADKYYFAVKGLLEGLDFDEPDQISPEVIQGRMLKLRTKKDFSAARCGLAELQACFPKTQLPEESFFIEYSKQKRNYQKRAFEPISLDTVSRKINAIRDKRLKLAYRLMLASGARVAEAAALTPEDIAIDGSSIQIYIQNGKGGKSRVIDGIEDEYLARELTSFKASISPGETLFYESGHMKNKAGELGFECHDLRRAFAKTYLLKQRREAPDAYIANGNLMAAMGHDKWRTTKRYLRRNIEL